MEDQKLRTPFDSINASKDLWSKELSKIRSLLKELVGEVATVSLQNRVLIKENRDPSLAPPMFHEHASIKFGRFCGDNPEAWIFQAEHYFEFYKIAERYKLSLASLHLDGEALEWYRWLFRNKQLADWKHFTAKVMTRFHKQHLESQRCHLANSRQVTSAIEYQSRFEDVSSGYGDFDVLASGTAYVYPQRSTITNSPLPKCCDEQSEGNNKTNALKVFDDLSKRSKDINSIDISCKFSQLEVEDPHMVCKLTVGDTTEAYFPNDLAYSISPTIEATGCDNVAKSEHKNDEEEIISISNEPIEFVIANMFKPLLWIDSIVSINYYLAMLDIHKVLNDRSNQFLAGHSGEVYPQHGVRLAQCWKKMPSIPSTCSYAKIITRGITSRLGHDAIFLILNLFPADQFGLEFPFDPGSSLLAIYILVFYVASSDLDHDKFIMSTLRNSCNWVDTRHGRNFYDILLSKSRENVMEEKIRRMLQEFAESYSKQSSNILVNRVVKLLCAMFSQFLDCGNFPFDSVLNHSLTSRCVQTIQPRKPQPLPKLPFDFDGIVIIGEVDSKTKARVVAANFNSKMEPASAVVAAMLQGWKMLQLRSENTTTMLKHCFDYFGCLRSIGEKSVEVHEGQNTDVISGGVTCVIHPGNLKLAKGAEVHLSILRVEKPWFHSNTKAVALDLPSNLDRNTIVLPLWLYSNLEDKVLF